MPVDLPRFDLPPEPQQNEYRSFKVLNPIFKNGKLYKKGTTVKLEVRTGANFLEAGDVELVD